MYYICFMAPPLLFLKADKNWRQMFVLNTPFSALLLAFNPISILSFFQKVLIKEKEISVIARDKPQKQGSSFAHYLPPQYFLIAIYLFFHCLAIAIELEASQALHLCSVLHIFVQLPVNKYQ